MTKNGIATLKKYYFLKINIEKEIIVGICL